MAAVVSTASVESGATDDDDDAVCLSAFIFGRQKLALPQPQSLFLPPMHRSASMLAWVVAYAALALVFLAAPSSAIGVVSIDYGTEWIKAALVKPGMPFDVVLGRDSKRKVQALSLIHI